MKSLDPSLLSAFVTICETGSVSQAASALGLSQPAVTKQINRLERQLGAPLLRRALRPVQPTPAGKSLLPHARAILDQMHRLYQDISRHHSAQPDLLRIGMTDSLSENMGAELLSSLMHRAQHLEIRSGISPWLEAGFRNGDFDFLIDMSPISLTPDLRALPLFRDPLVIVMPLAWAGRPFEEVIAQEPHVAYSRNSKFGTLCELAQQALRPSLPPSRFNFDSTQSLLRFVQVGYGWAVTSCLCLFQSRHILPELHIAEDPGAHGRSFHLIHRKGEWDHLADEVAGRFWEVFDQLTLGPWHALAPGTSALLRAQNAVANQA